MKTLICKTCGKEFQVIDCRESTAKYCSNECQRKSLRGELNCECCVCGKKLHRKAYIINKNKHVTCSRECLNKLKSIIYCGKGNNQYGLKGDKNSSFKGTKLEHRNHNLIDTYLYKPEHPFANSNGRVLEYRYIVEQNYKLFNQKYFETINNKVVLKKSTQIHHINRNHNDNRKENLLPVTRSEHTMIHNMFKTIIRDTVTGKITGVLKYGELLEKPKEVNQQPSLNGNILEGSETNSRILITKDSNTDTSAVPFSKK